MIEGKKNVLQKLIIPKVVATIKYIATELDEREREETFRLKRFKELKMKKVAAAEKLKHIEKVPQELPKVVKKKKAPSPPKPEIPVCECSICGETKPVEEMEICKCSKHLPIKLYKKEEDFKVDLSCQEGFPCEYGPVEKPFKEILGQKRMPCQSVADKWQYEEELPCHFQAKREIPCHRATVENKERLQILVAHLSEVIDLSKQCERDGLISSSMDTFIQICTSAREKLDEIAHPSVCSFCSTRASPKESVCGETTQISKEAIPCDTCGEPSYDMIPCKISKVREPCATVSIEKEPCGKPITSISSVPCSTVVKRSVTKLQPCQSESPYTGELGCFETKFKEIIRVTRVLKQDGTIEEEKQVITVKTERKNPSTIDDIDSDEKYIMTCCNAAESHESRKSEKEKGTCYCSKDDKAKKTKSNVTQQSAWFDDPSVRNCLSDGHKRQKESNICKICSCSTISAVSKCLPDPRKSPFNLCCDSKVEDSVESTELQTANLNYTGSEVSFKPKRVQTAVKSTCCIPINGTHKQMSNKCTDTDFISRDTCNSICDKKRSRSANCVPQSTKSKGKERRCKSCSALLTTPDTTRDGDDDTDLIVGLKQCVIDALKTILLPLANTISDNDQHQEPIVKNICENCLSKIMKAKSYSNASSKLSEFSQRFCANCKAPIGKDEDFVRAIDSSYTLDTKTTGYTSCRSNTIDSFASSSSKYPCGHPKNMASNNSCCKKSFECLPSCNSAYSYQVSGNCTTQIVEPSVSNEIKGLDWFMEGPQTVRNHTGICSCHSDSYILGIKKYFYEEFPSSQSCFELCDCSH